MHENYNFRIGDSLYTPTLGGGYADPPTVPAPHSSALVRDLQTLLFLSCKNARKCAISTLFFLWKIFCGISSAPCWGRAKVPLLRSHPFRCSSASASCALLGTYSSSGRWQFPSPKYFNSMTPLYLQRQSVNRLRLTLCCRLLTRSSTVARIAI